MRTVTRKRRIEKDLRKELRRPTVVLLSQTTIERTGLEFIGKWACICKCDQVSLEGLNCQLSRIDVSNDVHTKSLGEKELHQLSSQTMIHQEKILLDLKTRSIVD